MQVSGHIRLALTDVARIELRLLLPGRPVSTSNPTYLQTQQVKELPILPLWPLPGLVAPRRSRVPTPSRLGPS